MLAFTSLSEFFCRGNVVNSGWTLLSCVANSYEHPGAIPEDLWETTQSRTLAEHLRSHSRLERSPSPELDGQDHYYRVSLARNSWPEPGVEGRRLLVFDGLASVVNVWFNGVLVAETANMFRRFALDVTDLVSAENGAECNTLVLHFRALPAWFKSKKGPRRWPTRLVNERNLRFLRSTLLGRMPGWTPPWPAVGPFRGLRLVTARSIVLEQVRCEPAWHMGAAQVTIQVRLRTVSPLAEAVHATLRVADSSATFALQRDGQSWSGSAQLVLSEAHPWWPHTHGAQPLYDAQLRVEAGKACESFELGRLGFRKIELLPPEEFGFRVNGVDVFCRGACWAPLDVVTLSSEVEALRKALHQVKACGMNMLRISGTLAYEVPEFHALCDELGILVWQDFMFANMDYPRGDAEFDAEVREEVAQVLERLSPRCSSALLCGGSETEQQAAMMGLPAFEWEHPLWRTLLPSLIDEFGTQIPYWYSTPGGAGLPFWPENGCTHYYGVGAYLRPLADARAVGLRFASECLAFANPPDDARVNRKLRSRVPQDNGASWDFADVTRHYVREFFGVAFAELEKTDPEQYATFAARAVAYASHQTQTHLRDPETPARGSLIWMLRDLEPGWGWGIVDSCGQTKSSYRALQHIWAPQAVWFVDEGLRGLSVVVANDPDVVLTTRLEVALLHPNGTALETVFRELNIEPHSGQRFRVEELFGRFIDSSYAYRFGPPGFDRIQARLLVAEHVISEEQRALCASSALDPKRPALSSEGA